MADISASEVMKLRKVSGQGMMDCKKALQEADGDFDAALDSLRKKGAATLAKRAGRETSEGIVVGSLSEDGKVGTLASLCCETDFVAKSDDFLAASEKVADYAVECDAEEGAENLAETELDGKKLSKVITELVSKTGEKTEIGEYYKLKLDGPGLLSSYIHFNKKAGAMVQIETSDESVSDSEEMKKAALDIAMHITAAKPLALDKESFDPETIEKEKEVFAEQVSDKPANIIEKIVEGKMGKFYSENCLIEQPFIKNDEMSVKEVVDQAAEKAGGTAKIKRFVRIDVTG